MNMPMLARRYHAAALLLLVVVYYINLPGYSSTIKSVVPKVFGVYTFLLLLLPIVFAAISERKLFSSIARSPLTYWCYGYLLIALIWFPLSGHSNVEQEVFKNRIVSVLYVIGFFVLFSEPWSLHLARKGIAFAVVLGAILHVIDIAMPGYFVSIDEQFANPGRAAGLYINANRAGAAIVLGFVVSWSVIDSRWRIPFLLAVLIGVVSTFSRSAILALLLAFLMLRVFAQIAMREIGIAITILGGILAIAVGMVFLIGNIDWVALWDLDNIMERIEFFSDPFAQRSASSNEREIAALTGLKYFAEHPLLGHGIGATYAWRFPVSTHNIYLYYAVEYGILGFLIFPLLIISCAFRSSPNTKPWVIAWATVIAFIGLFTHNALEESAFLITYAVIAAANRLEGSGLSIEPYRCR
jgi:O-antigen ligase